MATRPDPLRSWWRIPRWCYPRAMAVRTAVVSLSDGSTVGSGSLAWIWTNQPLPSDDAFIQEAAAVVDVCLWLPTEVRGPGQPIGELAEGHDEDAVAPQYRSMPLGTGRSMDRVIKASMARGSCRSLAVGSVFTGFSSSVRLCRLGLSRDRGFRVVPEVRRVASARWAG